MVMPSRQGFEIFFFKPRRSRLSTLALGHGGSPQCIISLIWSSENESQPRICIILIPCKSAAVSFWQCTYKVICVITWYYMIMIMWYQDVWWWGLYLFHSCWLEVYYYQQSVVHNAIIIMPLNTVILSSICRRMSLVQDNMISVHFYQWKVLVELFLLCFIVHFCRRICLLYLTWHKYILCCFAVTHSITWINCSEIYRKPLQVGANYRFIKFDWPINNFFIRWHNNPLIADIINKVLTNSRKSTITPNGT